MGSLEKLPQKKARIEPITNRIQFSLSSTLDLVSEELDKSPYGRIRQPFESPIDKKSIQLQDLLKWGSMPIELLGAHEEDGGLILSTGEKDSAGMDRPWLKLGLREHIHWANLQSVVLKRMQSRQPYIVHNHPSGSYLPSGGDINILRPSVDVEILLTSKYVTLFHNYLNPVRIPRSQFRQLRKQGKWGEFLKKEGVLKAVIPFTDEEKMRGVLDFMRGKKTWEDIKVLTMLM